MTDTGQRADDFEVVGSGQNVFASDVPVIGRVKWLDTPADVIDFVENEPAPGEVIVVARGGTTTFLSVALNAGVKGVVTLQGAPESHLGILSREYGIPCVMSVAFEKGVRTSRGEVIPADGVQIRLDVTARPTATVAVEAGAPVSDEPVAEAPGGPTPEEMEQIMALLVNFRGEVPHGVEGDAVMRSRMASDVIETTDTNATDLLTAEQTNDLLQYLTWNEWDALAARATEGESGLIPRQEYEALGILNSWYKHPEWLGVIRDAVGPEGLIEIGRRAKNEFGTKINILHLWALATAPFFGRGIAIELGLTDEWDNPELAIGTMSSVRGMYHGLWGGGPMYSSGRGYHAVVLNPDVVERIAGDLVDLDTDETRSTFQKFNGAAEMLAFLLHFDNRLGLADSGPYDLPDGGRLIVRDLFVNEPAYAWADHCAGLPYAVTIGMYFAPGAEIDLKVIDISTLFSEPANYLRFVDKIAVYRRELLDTPMSEVTTVDFAGMDAVRARCEAASSSLYRQIAGMTHREKLLAGAATYTAGFALPVARAAGVYDKLVADHGFYELHPDAQESIEQLGKVAAEMIPRMFLTGAWGVPVPEGERPEGGGSEEFGVVHALAVRGLAGADGVAAASGLEPGPAQEILERLLAAGQVRKRDGRVRGYQLTPSGRTRHSGMLRVSRQGVDMPALAAAYEDFLPLNQDFKQLASDAQTGTGRDGVESRLAGVHERLGASLGVSTGAAPRFGIYQGRFDAALDRYRGGDDDALARPMSESYHDVWMELHEDLLATIGRDRAAEDGS